MNRKIKGIFTLIAVICLIISSTSCLSKNGVKAVSKINPNPAPFIDMKSEYLKPHTFNLSYEGTLDWAAFGLDGTPNGYDRKKTKNKYIGKLETSNMKSLYGWEGGGSLVNFSWQDGTPHKNSLEKGQVVFTNDENSSFIVKIKNLAKPITLKIYTTSLSSTGFMEVYTAKSKFRVMESNDTSPGIFEAKVFTVNLYSPVKDDEITIKYTLASKKESDANIGISAVTMRPFTNGSNSKIPVKNYALNSYIVGSSTICRQESYNLTNEGNVDWVAYGVDGDPDSYERKNTNTAYISNLSTEDGSSMYAWDNPASSVKYCWTDGTYKEESASSGQVVYTDDNYTCLKFTVPANSTGRDLKIFTTTYSGLSTIEARLSDDSCQPYIININAKKMTFENRIINLRFASNTADKELVVRMYLNNKYSYSSYAGINAVTLSDSISPEATPKN